MQAFLMALAFVQVCGLHMVRAEVASVGSGAEITSGPVEPQVPAAAKVAARVPGSCTRHAVFVSHGLLGAPRALQNVADAIAGGQPESGCPLLVHNCAANAGTLPFGSLKSTTDGVAAGGTRLAHEIADVLAAHPDVSHISLVGMSLGGAYMRYAAGLLLPLHVGQPAPTGRGLDRFADMAVSRRVHFQLFVSIASPHTGVRGHLDAVMQWGADAGLGGVTADDMLLAALPEDWAAAEHGGMAAYAAHVQAPVSAQLRAQLALRHQSLPLLLSMATIGSAPWTALAAFQHRMLVASEVKDARVPFRAAALSQDPAWLGTPRAATELGLEQRPANASAHLEAVFLQQAVDTSNSSAVWATYNAWSAALTAEGSAPSPEVVMLASLRAMGGWLTLQARWDDALGYLLNHNRMSCPRFISWFGECLDFLHVFAQHMLRRM